MADLYTMQDPTTQYPTPPFKKQPQRVPGLAKTMIPKPDHIMSEFGVKPNRAIMEKLISVGPE